MSNERTAHSPSHMVAERGYAQVTSVCNRLPARSTTAGVEEKEKTEENEERFAYAREYAAKEAELQKIFGSILAVKDKVTELSIEVDNEKCVAKTDLNERARIRKENFEWDGAVAHRVWCCGPETEGSQCGCARPPSAKPKIHNRSRC